MQFAAFTETGLTRRQNEDALLLQDRQSSLLLHGEAWCGSGSLQPPWLACVADGMGGHNGGAVAAALVLELMLERFHRLFAGETAAVTPLTAALQQVFFDADNRLRSEAERNPQLSGMGTTLAGICCAAGGELILFHAGDSRIYSAASDSCRQLTEDHNLAARLQRENRSCAPGLGEALTNCLGGNSGDNFLEIRQLPAFETRLLLCSDGLYNFAEQEELHRLSRTPPEQFHDAAVRSVTHNGAGDNYSAILCIPEAHAQY